MHKNNYTIQQTANIDGDVTMCWTLFSNQGLLLNPPGNAPGEVNIAFIATDEEIGPETSDSGLRLRKLGFLASKNRNFCTMTHNLHKGRNVNQDNRFLKLMQVKFAENAEKEYG